MFPVVDGYGFLDGLYRQDGRLQMQDSSQHLPTPFFASDHDPVFDGSNSSRLTSLERKAVSRSAGPQLPSDKKYEDPFDQKSTGFKQRSSLASCIAMFQLPDPSEDLEILTQGTPALSVLEPEATDGSQEILATNIGSAGHPELCRRPCIFFGDGRCNQGESCNFCHSNHVERIQNLDKRNRQVLRSLPQADRLALVFPLLQERAKAAGIIDHVSEILQIADLWQRSLSPATCRQGLGKVQRSMSRMPFSTLLALAIGHSSEDDVEMAPQEACHAMSLDTNLIYVQLLKESLAVCRSKLSLPCKTTDS